MRKYIVIEIKKNSFSDPKIVFDSDNQRDAMDFAALKNRNDKDGNIYRPAVFMS